MQVAVWIGLGIVAGLIAKPSSPRAVAPPPVMYLPTYDESVAVLVRPVPNDPSMLIPVLLGVAAAMGGGALCESYNIGKLLGLASISGFDGASATLAAGAALLVVFGYRAVAASMHARPAVSNHRRGQLRLAAPVASHQNR